MKKLLLILSLCLMAVAARAANPSYQSFDGVWFLQTFPSSPLITINTNDIGWVTPQTFGAKGGVNDDTAAFQAAMDSGYAVYIPPHTNYTVGKLKWNKSNTGVCGMGSKLTLLSSVTSGYMFDWGATTNIFMQGLNLDGNHLPDTNVQYWQASQGALSGVRAPCFAGNSVIMNVSAENFTDAGFRFIGTNTDGMFVNITQSERQKPMGVFNIEARRNYFGIDTLSFDASRVVEYFTMTAPVAHDNYYGLTHGGANLCVIGGQLSGNHVGAYVIGNGVNAAHGQWIGCVFNHSDIAIWCNGSGNSGEEFIGCDALATPEIRFTACSGIEITGGAMTPTVITADACSNVVIRDVRFNTSWPAITSVNGGRIEVLNNRQIDGPGTDGTWTFNSFAPVTLSEGAATLIVKIPLATGKSLTGRLYATVRANDATDFQANADFLVFSAVNKGGTVTTAISSSSPASSAVSAGSLTTTWTAVANGAAVDIKCSATSSLTQTTLQLLHARMELDSNDSPNVQWQ